LPLKASSVLVVVQLIYFNILDELVKIKKLFLVKKGGSAIPYIEYEPF